VGKSMIQTSLAGSVLALAVAAHSAPPAKPFERLDGCKLIANRRVYSDLRFRTRA
jgi:hypothetical protein